MKTVLMVAAGVAVGLTVVLAVLVQILERLVPLLVAATLAVWVLRLLRRRGSSRARRTEPWVSAPMVAPQPQPVWPVAAALPSGRSDSLDDLHLRWGAPVDEGLDSPAVITSHGAGAPGRRAGAGSRPARSARGRRP